MTVVWCSISAHGFGHAAQLIPILNELGKVIDDLKIIFRTSISAHFFEEYMQVPWEHSNMQQDIGCIQRGPLDIDIEATWEAYQQFHANWEQRVSTEAQAIQAARANLVISNISHLSIAGAAQAQCPVVAIASLSWDRVLEPFAHECSRAHATVLDTIRQSYSMANHLIRLYPCIEMPAFPLKVDVGPSISLAEPSSDDLRKLIEAESGETIVLVGFGGIPLADIPFEQMETCVGFRFLVGGISIPSSMTQWHALEDIPMSFGEILSQIDVVMTKPGYATIATAIQCQIPLVYVRRNNFVDEQCLVNYAHRYGRAIELARADFESGEWEQSLRAVLNVMGPAESPPSPGHGAVVGFLREYLQA